MADCDGYVDASSLFREKERTRGTETGTAEGGSQRERTGEKKMREKKISRGEKLKRPRRNTSLRETDLFLGYLKKYREPCACSRMYVSRIEEQCGSSNWKLLTTFEVDTCEFRWFEVATFILEFCSGNIQLIIYGDSYLEMRRKEVSTSQDRFFVNPDMHEFLVICGK